MAQSLFNSSAVLTVSAVDWRTFRPRPPLVLSAKSPHKCQRCSYCFTFETKKNFSRYLTIRDDFAPYDSSSLEVSLKDVVHAAQNGCYFHQWILHLICRNIHDPNAKFPSHAEVEITLKLQKIYKTEFIPHDFVQQRRKASQVGSQQAAPGNLDRTLHSVQIPGSFLTISCRY
jgi:hypothetical protein